MSKYNKDFLKDLDKKLCLVPLTLDHAFKRIFANDNSTDYTILKMFLISVLKLEIDPYTCQIDILQSELPKENSKEYKKTVDINVLLNNNIHYQHYMFEDCHQNHNIALIRSRYNHHLYYKFH